MDSTLSSLLGLRSSMCTTSSARSVGRKRVWIPPPCVDDAVCINIDMMQPCERALGEHGTVNNTLVPHNVSSDVLQCELAPVNDVHKNRADAGLKKII